MMGIISFYLKHNSKNYSLERLQRVARSNSDELVVNLVDK